MEKMRQTHLALFEEMGHWNTTIMAERDVVLKEIKDLKRNLLRPSGKG